MKIAVLIAVVVSVSPYSFAFASPNQCLNPSTIRKVLAPIYREKAAYIAVTGEEISNVPQLRRCGLALGINDLRNVKTFRELVGVVEWGLNNAGVCQPCE